AGLVLCHDVVFIWPAQEATAWALARFFRRRSSKGTLPRPGDPLVVPPEAGEWTAHAPMPEGPPLRPVVARHALPPIMAADAAAMCAGGHAVPQAQVYPSGSTASPGFPALPGTAFQLPPREMLEPPAPFPIQDHETKIHARAMLLERT